MKKVTTYLLFLLIIILLAVGGAAMVVREKEQKKEQERIAQIRQEQLEKLRPLMDEKQTLQRQINAIHSKLSGSENQAGMVVVLYRSPDQRLQEEALEVMQAYGIEGTICISQQSFPGQEGCLSVDEIRKLTDAGWDLCVPFLDEASLSQLLNDIERCGLPAPHTLFLAGEVSAPELAALIQQFDFQNVVYIGQKPGISSDDVFWIRAYSHREDTTTINVAFEPLQSKRDCLVVTAGFDDAEQAVYSTARLTSILDYCEYYHITVAPVSMLEKRSHQGTGDMGDEMTLNTELDQLTQQLDEVQNQIDEINRQLGQ